MDLNGLIEEFSIRDRGGVIIFGRIKRNNKDDYIIIIFTV